jgi:hypothetical protein
MPDLTIRVSGRVIERTIWILVVIALLVGLMLTILFKTPECPPCEEGIYEEVAEEEPEVQEEPREETPQAPVTPPKPETKPPVKEPDEPEGPVLLSGKVTVAINKVPCVIKNKGMVNQEYLKVKDVDFSIDNQDSKKDEMNPRVILYFYDADDPASEKTIKYGSGGINSNQPITWEDEAGNEVMIEPGKKFTGSVHLDDYEISWTRPNIKTDKTVKIQILDENLQSLTTATYKLVASSCS